MTRPPLYWLDFFVDLPFDLGRREGTVKRPEIDFEDPTLGRVPGWEDATIDPRTGVPEYPETGVWPSTTFVWRRRTRRSRHPVTAPWEIFGDDLKLELPWVKRVTLRVRALPRHLRRSYLETNSMVRLIRLDSPPAIPLPHEWLIDQFKRALGHLNDFLVPLSWAAADPSIGPLHPRQLAPIITGFQTDVGTRLQGGPADRLPIIIAVHELIPSQGHDLPERVIEQALEMAPDPRSGRPFLPILDFMVATRGALARGQNAQAVIDATRSIELLVNQVILITGPKKDPKRYAAQRLPTLMDAPFKSRLLDHYAKLLGATVDLASENEHVGRWWNRCYLLRNRIVHEGYRPADDEAAKAVSAAEELNLWTGAVI